MTKLYILTANLEPFPMFGKPRSMIVDVFKTESEALALQDDWMNCKTEPWPLGIGVIAFMFRAFNSTIDVIEVEEPDIEILVISAQAKQEKVALADWFQCNR